ncbi:DUF6483 family protein [Lactiplantibacillus daowaiensis]
MAEESDYILRQIHSLAEGFGYLLSRAKDSNNTEIVFPGTSGPDLPHQVELRALIADHRYQVAATRLVKLRYAMTEDQFFKLALWFYQTLNGFDEATLQAGDYSKASIVAGLKQLTTFKDD